MTALANGVSNNDRSGQPFVNKRTHLVPIGLAVLGAQHGKPNWDKVGALVNEWRPSVVIVGNPINEGGESTDLSAKAARFARQLEGRFQLRVELHDERFTSKEAKLRAKETGHRGDYAAVPIDDLAAAIILESYLTSET